MIVVGCEHRGCGKPAVVAYWTTLSAAGIFAYCEGHAPDVTDDKTLVPISLSDALAELTSSLLAGLLVKGYDPPLIEVEP